MIKKCPKCNRELDTNKDFCVLCGESYKNEELDNKINEEIIEKQKEELKKEKQKEKTPLIPIIIYGLAIILIGPFALGILFIISLFGLDIKEELLTNPLFLIIVVLVAISVLGILVLLRKDNKSNQKK